MKYTQVFCLRIPLLCLTVLLCTILLGACTAPVKVVDVIDITAMDARDYQFYAGEDLIDEDDEWLYYLDRTRANGGYVEYSDGSTRSIRDALAAGDITRDDLNNYGILHMAYSKQYADEPILETPPTLTVLCADASVEAYRGTCTWAAGCYLAESPVGAKAKGYMTPLVTDDTAPERVVLLFEIAPDSLAVRYNGRELDVTETAVTLEDGSTVNAFSVELMEGSEVYEIDAVWSSGWEVKDPVWYYTRRNTGEVCYGFYTADTD